jgi:hypothetical protein
MGKAALEFTVNDEGGSCRTKKYRRKRGSLWEST